MLKLRNFEAKMKKLGIEKFKGKKKDILLQKRVRWIHDFENFQLHTIQLVFARPSDQELENESLHALPS